MECYLYHQGCSTNESHLVQDAETSCDFIPNNIKNDYIKNDISKDDIINNNMLNKITNYL